MVPIPKPRTTKGATTRAPLSTISGTLPPPPSPPIPIPRPRSSSLNKYRMEVKVEVAPPDHVLQPHHLCNSIELAIKTTGGKTWMLTKRCKDAVADEARAYPEAWGEGGHGGEVDVEAPVQYPLRQPRIPESLVVTNKDNMVNHYDFGLCSSMQEEDDDEDEEINFPLVAEEEDFEEYINIGQHSPQVDINNNIIE